MSDQRPTSLVFNFELEEDPVRDSSLVVRAPLGRRLWLCTMSAYRMSSGLSLSSHCAGLSFARIFFFLAFFLIALVVFVCFRRQGCRTAEDPSSCTAAIIVLVRHHDA